jgi:hypothetical protein
MNINYLEICCLLLVLISNTEDKNLMPDFAHFEVVSIEAKEHSPSVEMCFASYESVKYKTPRQAFTIAKSQNIGLKNRDYLAAFISENVLATDIFRVREISFRNDCLELSVDLMRRKYDNLDPSPGIFYILCDIRPFSYSAKKIKINFTSWDLKRNGTMTRLLKNVPTNYESDVNAIAQPSSPPKPGEKKAEGNSKATNDAKSGNNE